MLKKIISTYTVKLSEGILVHNGYIIRPLLKESMQVLDFFHSDFQAIFDLITYLENKNVLYHTSYFQHCRVQ